MDIINNTTNMKNRNLAIFEDTDATPLKPKSAAITAIIKNIIAHINIISRVLVEHNCALCTLTNLQICIQSVDSIQGSREAYLVCFDLSN
ncbi:hypothetical protein AWW68_01500 [Roseivirga spongicola]|uniref:Uncharacterized protein n=1 Tax=Roseivirga spongicola TaxID=333140 RepID=A0A150XFI5_9BACT|nr:hypothetical protein AWW68_01500 [Roseivirga spongicola]